MKICTKCKIEKELSEFSKDKSRKDKLFPQCKKCALHYHNSHKKQQNKKSLDYHHKHKELLNDNAKQWRENNSQKVSEYNKIYRTQHIKERHIIIKSGIKTIEHMFKTIEKIVEFMILTIKLSVY